MEYELNDDQLAFQQTAKKFAQDRLAPQSAHWDATCTFPKDAFVEAGNLGFMAMYVPEDKGGIGLNRLDSSIIMEELAAGCTSTAAFISIHNMAFNMLANHGKEELVEQWSHSLASGEKLASYCLTEPGAGSDAASLKTKAEKEDEYYYVSGSKVFISGAGDTDILICMVRTGGPGPKGISCLAIPADLPGITFGKKEEKLGWSNQPTRQIHFDNVKVPVQNLLANEGEGFKLAMQGLDGGRINIAACSVGTARQAIEHTLGYVKEREQFNTAISQFQNTQFTLADMSTNLIAARQMIRLAAYKLDQKAADASVHCAMAKRFATDAGFDICDQALQLHGGYGYIREYPIERFFRDTRVHRILEGTNEVMRIIIAKQLLDDESFQLIS